MNRGIPNRRRMVVSVATPRAAAASLPRSWVPLRESPTAYEVSRAASRALVRRQLAYASSGDGAPSAVPTINSETLTAFLSDLRLDTFEPLLARLPAGFLATRWATSSRVVGLRVGAHCRQRRLGHPMPSCLSLQLRVVSLNNT